MATPRRKGRSEPDATDATTVRRGAILDAAAGVFLRYGFKKTSMDDLARAAGLSRQGLYLHFATKEVIFTDAILQLVAVFRAAVRNALARDELDLEDRLLGAFEAMHGQAIGHASAQHMNELLEASVRFVGPVVEEVEKDLVTDVARVLRGTDVAARWKAVGVSANDLAAHLSATSTGLKHAAPTPADYHDRLRTAVRIVCRGAPR